MQINGIKKESKLRIENELRISLSKENSLEFTCTFSFSITSYFAFYESQKAFKFMWGFSKMLINQWKAMHVNNKLQFWKVLKLDSLNNL